MGLLFHLFVALLPCQCLIQTVAIVGAFSPQPHFATSSVSITHARVGGGRRLAAGGEGDAPSSSSNERRPWDLFRFVSQSSKFVSPPSLPFLGGGRNGERRKIQPGETLWSPSLSQNFFSFAPLDDVVMGGASSSTVDNNMGMWTGTVTDANNGGFVGIRSTPFRNGLALDTSNCQGIELRLRKGDGRRFKFVVRDSTEFNGICWTTEFDAAEKGTVVRIPFSKQAPTVFAKTVSGKAFAKDNVVGFQVAYSKFAYDGKLNEKFQLGDFALQLLEMKSY